jgi:hypothetical protein
MNTHRLIIGVRCAVLCLLLPLAAAGQITKTELAGNSLTQYPFFEYVRAFNVNAPVKVAIDPTRFPTIVGDTCDIYVVVHKTDWATNPALLDITPGGALTQTFSATNIQGNTFEVAAALTLNANAGAGLGVGKKFKSSGHSLRMTQKFLGFVNGLKRICPNFLTVPK